MMAHGARMAAGLGLLGGLPQSTVWAESSTSGAKGFKIGACDWTLGKKGDPSSLELAKRLGLDGVQVDLGKADDNLPVRNPDLQKKFLEARKEQGVEISSIAIGALNDVPYKSDPRAEEWVADSIDVCKAFGVTVVLIALFSNGDLRDDPKGVDTVVERLNKVAPKAEKAGVLLGLESWLNADEHLDILSRVGSPAVKVYYDVGNMQHVGHDVPAEIRKLGRENICEFHAKDYGDLYGKGTTDFPAIRQAMDDIGYRGWMQIEGVHMPLGLEESIKYDLEYLRTIFPRTL
jgi:sugar phosphate isomerase/epimerase